MSRFNDAQAFNSSGQFSRELFACYSLLALAQSLALNWYDDDLPKKTRAVFGRHFLVIKRALRSYFGPDHDLGEVELWQPTIGKPAVKTEAK